MSLISISEQIIPKTKDIKASILSIGDELGSFAKENPLLSGAAVVAVAGGATAIVRRVTRKKTSKKRTTLRKRKKSSRKKLTKRQKLVRRIKKRKGRQSPYTAGARKDRSTRRIRHTKNGQPYVILKSGKARFIKKSSARRSRKIKGGRY